MLYKVFAVIVTYNPERSLLLNQCDVLKEQVCGLIYVDNNSTESLLNILPTCDKLSFVLNDRNLGLGKAQNIGIKRAFEEGATHVILFDQDSIPDVKLIDCLLSTEKQYMEMGVKVGLVGPSVYNNYKNPPELTPAVIQLGFNIEKSFSYTTVLEVEYCIASGSLIRKDLFKDVGWMDERLFIDALDLEWCQRAKYKGYKILLCPLARIYHELGNGINDRILSHSPKREYYICRNNILLSKMKHIPIGYRLRKLVLTPLRPIFSLCKFRFSYSLQGFKGIFEGLFG